MTLGSLFDGSGTCPLAATMCGIKPVWASEIESYPIRVTRKNFPEMQHLGDITQINGAAIEPVDIVAFGSPCQGLSAAGAQKGIFDDDRSNLFFEAIRVIKEMRVATHGKYPRYVIWENVPGAFSSNKGRDFLAVLRAFAEAAGGKTSDVPEPPAKAGKLKWGGAGIIVGDGYSIAWRVLDAKYWGVPQRRKRIYLVCDFAGRRAGEILFKREGLRRDFAQSRKARKETAADAVGSTGGSGGAGRVNDGMSYHLFEPRSALDENWAETDVKNALRANASKSSHIVCYALQGNGIDRADTAGCNGKGWREDVCYTLNTVDRPAIAYSADCRNMRLNEEISGTLQAKGNGGYSLNYQNPVIYQNPKRGEYVKSEVGSTLLAHLAVEPRDIVVYDARGNGDGQIVPTLTGDHESRVTDYTALAIGNGQLDQIYMSDTAGTLNCMHDQQAVLLKRLWRYIVRRLTPLECCRLQGFPDWWEDGVSGSDSARYKMWGNGMALPCVLYVMEGITDG
jgi:DNA (cytosine-5)-methyltransferase 1